MDDAILLRFLRAREFDVTEVNAMILSAQRWRKDFGVGDVVKNFELTKRREVDRYYPRYYHKTDKDGRPVYIECLGQINVVGLKSVTNEDDLLRRFVFEYEKFLAERLPACTKAVGHPVETSCTILDIHGVSVTSVYRIKDHLVEAARIGKDRYPECVGKFCIINVPFGFATVWSQVVKPCLPDAMGEKINLVKASKVAETLLAQIPAENLSRDLGGNCQCVEGCPLSDAGPWKR